MDVLRVPRITVFEIARIIMPDLIKDPPPQLWTTQLANGVSWNFSYLSHLSMFSNPPTSETIVVLSPERGLICSNLDVEE